MASEKSLSQSELINPASSTPKISNINCTQIAPASPEEQKVPRVVDNSLKSISNIRTAVVSKTRSHNKFDEAIS